MDTASGLETLLPRLRDVYRDLHAHPELSFAEHRTAGIAAAWLRELGLTVTEGVGRTGVTGVLRRGEGPVVLLRADMDGLPVAEATGLAYASTARGVDPDGRDVPVMHACGHDVHVTCLLGALSVLAADDSWTGTVVAVLQPAEEMARGAAAMVEEGLYGTVPRPDVVLGQHVAPLPAGTIGLRAGPSFAATDSLRITLFGEGGHGSRPEATVDPVVLAAATVLRLQTVVSREIAGTETAVLTVGSVQAGTKSNIIPDEAVLLLNLRTYDVRVRAARRRRRDRLRRGARPRGHPGRAGVAAVQPLAALRAGHRPDARDRCAVARRRGPVLAPARVAAAAHGPAISQRRGDTSGLRQSCGKPADNWCLPDNCTASRPLPRSPS